MANSVQCMSVCVCVCVCVGEWSRRRWSSTENIHWRQVAWSLITGQWRSRVGRWLRQTSHSTAEQWTTTTTRPHWQKLSSQAVAARTIMLRWTHVTTVRCTPQRQWTAVVAWRPLIVSSAISTDSSLITSLTSTSLEHCWDSLFNTERLKRTLTDVLTEPNYDTNALHDLPLTLKREFTASNELYSDH